MSERRRYPGVLTVERDRGRAFYIKFRDADGRQVKSLAGYACDGWTPAKAAKLLAERSTDVRREGWRQPRGLTLAEWAEEFERDHLPARGLKRSTLESWRIDLRRHLVPGLGRYKLTELEQRPELIERYILRKLGSGLAPKTVRNQVVNLRRLLHVARTRRLIRGNPCDLIEMPRVAPYEPMILDAGQIADVLTAFLELAAEAENEREARWYATARRLWHLDAATAGRCGELFGLRWSRVSVADGTLRIVETFTRSRIDTPKSRESHRTIPLGPIALGILGEHWGESGFTGDDDLVFCHPDLGTHADPAKVRRDYVRPALRRAGIPDTFRPFHDLRHTALTHDATLHAPEIVRAKAGHANVQTTQRYVHLSASHLVGVAEASEARLFGETPDQSGTRMVPADSTPDP